MHPDPGIGQMATSGSVPVCQQRAIRDWNTSQWTSAPPSDGLRSQVIIYTLGGKIHKDQQKKEREGWGGGETEPERVFPSADRQYVVQDNE